MSLGDILNTGLSIMLSLGGASMIVIAASSWLAKLWANKILENEKGKIQKEFESIKASNQIYLNSLSNSSLLYIESQKALTTERTAAIKLLWSTLLDVKKNRPSIIIFLDLLPFSEYKYFHEDKQMQSFDESISIQELSKLVKYDVQNTRPFVDEKAIMYFWLYRALVGRLVNYIRCIREEGPPKQPWQKTKDVIEILSPVLSQETINIMQTKMWPTEELFEHIELLLVEHLRALSSGEKESSKSVEHLAELSKSATLLRRDDSNYLKDK